MKRPNEPERQDTSGLIPGKIVFVYALLSGLWIYFSDKLLDILVTDPHLMAWIGMLKGWIFILVTTLLLYVLIQRYTASLKAANDALAEQKERLLLSQVTIDMSSDMIFWIDNQGCFFYVNEAACKGLGYDQAELQTMTVPDINPDCSSEVYGRHWEELRATQQLRFESTYRRKDGRCYPVEISANHLVYGDKEFNCAIVRDISDRKLAEEALRESERRFRDLMERAHMIAVMLDQEGNIIFCNDYLLNLTGWTREELIGKNWFDTFLLPEIKPSMVTLFNEAIETGNFPYHHETQIKTRNGSHCLIVWDNTLLHDTAGSTVGIASLGIDVTQHRNLEAQLRHAQKLESIGTLAGGVAHDFNNILTVIMSCTEMLRNKLDQPERAMTLVNQILGSAQRAAKLTRSLLAFSRKQQMVSAPFDLNELVNQMHGFLERVIGEDVEVVTVLSEAEMPVLADKGQIEQVVMNIVSNARDAMPDGGRLVIRSSVHSMDGYIFDNGAVAAGDYAVLAISDTGSGIEPELQERIFEPFFTTKEVGKGTGLGLSMAYGIIRQHKGWISVESKPGAGSTFLIYLPLTAKKVGAVDRQGAICPGTGRILLVEDDEQVLQATLEILEECGYEVVTARSGTEALEVYRLRKSEFGLVILDVIMPRMNGRQVYEEIRKMNPEQRVLFTSGYTFDTLDRASLPPDCPFIPKPLIPQDFLDVVGRLLERRTKGSGG